MYYNKEISFKDRDSALKVASLLLEENYVVMLSKEEQLIILSYVWSDNSDRNNVIFIDKDDFFLKKEGT